MHRISFDPLDPASCRRAAQEVRQFQQSLEQKEREFLRRLGEIGVQVARARFDWALLAYAGDKEPVEVSVQETKQGIQLVAQGRLVGFLEFGTGVSHPEHSSGLYKHGTYGHGLGRLRSWRYPGADGQTHETTGNDPAEAMAGAAQEMAERAAELAREVFGHD